MDPLTQQLMQRQLGQGQPPPAQSQGQPPPTQLGAGDIGALPMPRSLMGDQGTPPPPSGDIPQTSSQGGFMGQFGGSLFPGTVPPSGQTASPPQLPVTPPNVPSKIPPQGQRFENAQAIQDAYRGGWNPNPVLLRAQLGNK